MSPDIVSRMNSTRIPARYSEKSAFVEHSCISSDYCSGAASSGSRDLSKGKNKGQRINSTIHDTRQYRSPTWTAHRSRPARYAGRAVRSCSPTSALTILHLGRDPRYSTRGRGDLLILGLDFDESIRRQKGPGRPFNSLDERMSMISLLPFVDLVVPFDEDTPWPSSRPSARMCSSRGAITPPRRRAGGGRVLRGRGHDLSKGWRAEHDGARRADPGAHPGRAREPDPG